MISRKDRYSHILDTFRKTNPDAASELNFSSPYQLLVAVMLSAQCTDKRVNMVTPAIFEKYPSPADLAKATFEEFYPLVRSVSYPNAKTTHLLHMAQMLVADFDGQVPSNVTDLQKLPGVGRKTANVVASIYFGAPVIAVDTHVFRVSRRLGLSSGRDVLKVEQDLTRNIPAELRGTAHHWIILHGRYVCTARAPKCTECVVSQWCRHYEQQLKQQLKKEETNK